MAARKVGARAARRASTREAEKLARAKERLFVLGPGGAPERPRMVESASVIEPIARSTRCPRCDGSLRVDEHAAVVVAGAGLRLVRATCVQCGSRRELWFRIAQLQ